MNPKIKDLLDAAFEHVLATHGHKGYLFWRELIGDQINFLYPDEKGKQIEVMPFWDEKPDGRIRVAVSILAVSILREPTRCFFVNQDGSVET